MKKMLLLAVALVCGLYPAWSQTAGGKGMTVNDLVSWQRITQKKIADNGKWAACKMEPWKGDATVYLYDRNGAEAAKFTPAGQFAFSASSTYLVVSQVPAAARMEELRNKKTKRDRMPMNSLILHALGGKEEVIDSVKTYRLAPESDWIVYQRGRSNTTLHVRSLDGKSSLTFPSVQSFGFAGDSDLMYFVEKTEDLKKLYLLDLESGKPALVKEGKGDFSRITFDEEEDRMAFLYAENRKTAYKETELWLSENGKKAERIVAAGHPSLPEGWVVSQYGSLSFSKSSARLFFGTSPEPRQVDKSKSAENRPRVQVWSWDEPVQYTVQQYNKNYDLQKNFRAVYRLKDGSVSQLATPELPGLTLSREGDGVYALLSTSRPYSVSSMWEGSSRRDYYLLNVDTGERKLLGKADYLSYSFSPAGKYLYWYADRDSSWFSLSLADGVRHQLTSPETFPAWNEENDIPDYPGSYGSAGWSDGDEDLYLYDRYDIWKFDPEGVEKPVNMTLNGRENRISYRLVHLDRDSRTVESDETLYLKGTDAVGKGNGYYTARFSRPAAPKVLMAGDYLLGSIVKAEDADRILFTKETYEMYPDVYYSNLAFRKPVRLTSGYRQQEPFVWGTAELISWTSLDGQKLEGVIYKPADFDPEKKYPMVVNFYERNSSSLYKYHMPEAHRSTVDYRLYNSNGYIVFNPDIRYRDGHPGESCYNCIIPGIEAVVAQGYVDEKAIAAQGHSWGGYQVAYLATRTDLFAAIESGAPVVNMFSAYGGIRWGSGMARAFQYEHGQSRLGTDPWSHPEIYEENSPLFNMDKVTTPILIMHNDQDGHVPWYQGIEYFVAMKRLEKPCWMLNYTGEPHWPTRLANKMDFQKRMMQFFDHFLKHKPMPKWMKEGLPAVDEPFELGY